MNARELPPCVVLGVESQIGLALVRELGRAGVPVVAVSHHPHALGLVSRHVWRKVVAGPPRSAAMLHALQSLGREFGRAALLTVSESNIIWLDSQRDALAPLVAALPDSKALAVALNKQRTLQAARDLGIAVPRFVQPRSLSDVDALARAFPFPAVAKWSDPNAVAASLELLGLAQAKAEYIEDAEILAAWGRRYLTLGQWPLLQEYCPGVGLGQFFYMHGGQAIRRFQHRRVAEWPPEGGFSSVCDAVPLSEHFELQERSIALLRAIGWQGVAMVEYRWDPLTDQAVLMEINGRFWGSLPLAVHAGAGFALLTYFDTMGLPLEGLPAPRDDIRCRMVATELKRLVRILFAPQRICDRRFAVRPAAELWRFVADYFRPNTRYYVWAWDDPKPFVADVCNAVMRLHLA